MKYFFPTLLVLLLAGCASERIVTYKGLDYKVLASGNYSAEKLAKEAYEKEKVEFIAERKQQLLEAMPKGTKLYRSIGTNLNVYNGKDCTFTYYLSDSTQYNLDSGGELPYIVEGYSVDDYEVKNPDDNPSTECVIISFSQDKTKKFTVPINKNYQTIGITTDNWVEEERKENERKQVLNKKECNKLLTSTTCKKENWSAYPLGHDFHNLAKKNKITPYQVARGTDYETRNIDAFQKVAILNDYIEIITVHIPEVCRDAYQDNEKLKEQYFNTFITKWNRCYEQLK